MSYPAFDVLQAVADLSIYSGYLAYEGGKAECHQRISGTRYCVF